MSEILRRYQQKQNKTKLSSVQHDIDLKKLRIADTGTAIPEGEKSSSGLLWKTLDLIDRPANALRVGLDNYIQGKYVGKGMLEGLTGKEHVYGSQILKSAGMQDGAARKIAGFGLDVLLDPILLSPAPIKAGALAVKGGTRAGSVAHQTASSVAEKGLLTSTVSAPFKITDDILTRVGVKPELKALMKESSNPVVRVGTKLTEAVPGGKAVAQGYVKTADAALHNLSPNYVKKNYSAIKIGNNIPDYHAGRKFLKDTVTDTVQTSLKKQSASVTTGVGRLAKTLAKYSDEEKMAVRALREDVGERLRKLIKAGNLDAGTASALRTFGTRGAKTQARIVESLDKALYRVQNPQLFEAAQVNRAEAYLGKWGTAKDIYDQTVKASQKHVAEVLQASPRKAELHDFVVNRMEDMARKEGITNPLDFYFPRQGKLTSLIDGNTSVKSLASSQELQRALNQNIDAHKYRHFLSTKEASQAAHKKWGEAHQIAQKHLADIGSTGHLSKYDKVRELNASGKTEEAKKLFKEFSLGDMKEAINKGLSWGELPPLIEVSETIGEALIERELQHITNITAKRMLDELVEQGAAIEMIPNARAQLKATLRELDTIRHAPPTPDMLQRAQELGVKQKQLQEYLRVSPHYVSAGDLGVAGGQKWLVHRQAADVLDRMTGSIKMNRELDTMTNMYRSLLGYFKQSVTGLNPGWYVTNFVGNMFNAYLAGVRNPNRFKAVIDLQAGTTASWRRVDKFLAQNQVPSIKAAKQGKQAWMNAEELLDVMRKESLEGFSSSMDNLGLSFKQVVAAEERALKREGMSAMGKATDVAKELAHTVKDEGVFAGGKQLIESSRVLADMMESNAKFAVYLDQMIKQTRPDMTYGSLKALSKQSGEHSLAYLFDYSNITVAEGRIKDVIPFYTFQRKNIPLQFQELAKQPEIFTQFHRLREGTLQDDYSQEELDQMPGWLRERAIGAGRGSLLTPNLPSESIDEVFDPRVWLGMVSPFITKPMELVTNQNFFTGAPIQKFEGQRAKALGLDVSPQVRHLLDTHGIVRGVNQATENWGKDIEDEKAVSMYPAAMLSRAVGRQYNPDINALNYAYGYDRQLADVIKALRAQGINVRTATEIRR